MSKENHGQYNLDVSSKGDNLAKVRNYVAEIARTCGFGQHSIYDIKVAVGEAIANAVEHGSPKGEANHVKISCQFDGANLTIKIMDEGVFKKAIPSPDNNVDYRGHGILIMLALMDRVSIDESTNGTTVSLTKCCRRDESRSA